MWIKIIQLVLLSQFQLILAKLTNSNNWKSNFSLLLETTIIETERPEHNLIFYIPTDLKLSLNNQYFSTQNSITFITEKFTNYRTFKVTVSRKKHSNYFIFLESSKDIVNLRKIFQASDAKGLFIVLLNISNTKFISEIIQACIDFDIINISIRVYDESNWKVKFYTWNPYQQKRRCGKAFTIKQKKVPSLITKKDYKKCILKISWVEGDPFVNHPEHQENPGLFILIFNNIAKLANITVEYQNDNTKYKNEMITNGTVWNLTQDLVNQNYDIALGRLFMNSSEDAPANFGPLYYCDKLIFVFPKAETILIYRHLLAVFSPELWFLFLAVFILLIIIRLAIVKYDQSYNSSALDDTFFDILAISIGLGINKAVTSTTAKIFFAFYFLYSINIVTIYLGKLSSIFTNPASSLVIDSDFKMFQNEWRLILNWKFERIGLGHHWFNGNPGYINHLIILTEGDYDIVRKTAAREVTAANSFQAVVDAHPYEASQVYTFQLLWFNASLFNTYYMRKNNPLNTVIYYWSQELLEKGLVLKWWRDVKDFNRKNSPKEDHAEASVIELKLAHYEEAFIMLGSGLALALLALIGELVVVWTNKHIKQVETEVFSLPDREK